MTGQYLDCPSCGRKVIEEGIVNRLEVALDRDGNHPVLHQIDKWMNSPRKSRQRKAADFVQMLTDFVNEPEQMSATELKYLRNEVWELKLEKMRLLFGGGECSESDVAEKSRRYLTLPARVMQAHSSVTCARATNSFYKDTDQTPRKQIELAMGILREDKLR